MGYFKDIKYKRIIMDTLEEATPGFAFNTPLNEMNQIVDLFLIKVKVAGLEPSDKREIRALVIKGYDYPDIKGPGGS